MFLLETESAPQKKITSLPRASGLIFFEIRKKCFYQKQNPFFRKKLPLFQGLRAWFFSKYEKSVSIRNRIRSSEKNYLSSKGFGPGFFRNTKKVFLSETESALQKKFIFSPSSQARFVSKKQKRRPRLYGPSPFSQFLNSLYFCSALLCCYRD